MTKRILSAILALCLLLSVIPMASAQGTGITAANKAATLDGDPSLSVPSGKNPTQLISGKNYTMTYKRDDAGFELIDYLVIFKVNLTGKETQAQLNQLAADLIWADADAELVSAVVRDPQGSKTVTAEFDCRGIYEDGTYLFVVLFGELDYNEYGDLDSYIYPDTAIAVPVTVYTPHSHVWKLVNSVEVWPQRIDTINYYICEECGEPMTQNVHNCTSTQFLDVPSTSNWAHMGIDFCIKNGLMNGVAGNRFDPNGLTTRAQFVTILWRQAGSPEPTKTAPFVDVKADTWYAKAAAWASENGIVNGTDATHFSPDVPLTRQMCAAILYRYTANVLNVDMSHYIKGANDLVKFADRNKVDSYAKDALCWATYVDIITGYQNGNVYTLKPNDTATRAQIAAIFMRYMDFRAR